MNLKKFIEINNFKNDDFFNLKIYPEIEEVYFKELFVVEGDHSDDYAGIFLIKKNSDYYLAYPSSLADALADETTEETMSRLLKATLVFCGVPFSEEDIFYDTNHYFFSCKTIMMKLNKRFDINLNQFIVLSATFQNLVEKTFHFENTKLIDEILKK